MYFPQLQDPVFLSVQAAILAGATLEYYALPYMVLKHSLAPHHPRSIQRVTRVGQFSQHVLVAVYTWISCLVWYWQALALQSLLGGYL